MGLMQGLLRQQKIHTSEAFLNQALFEIPYPRIKLKCWLFIFKTSLVRK